MSETFVALLSEEFRNLKDFKRKFETELSPEEWVGQEFNTGKLTFKNAFKLLEENGLRYYVLVEERDIFELCDNEGEIIIDLTNANDNLLQEGGQIKDGSGEYLRKELNRSHCEFIANIARGTIQLPQNEKSLKEFIDNDPFFTYEPDIMIAIKRNTKSH